MNLLIKMSAAQCNSINFLTTYKSKEHNGSSNLSSEVYKRKFSSHQVQCCAEDCSLLFYALSYLFFFFWFLYGDLSLFFNAKMETISETLACIDITHRSGWCLYETGIFVKEVFVVQSTEYSYSQVFLAENKINVYSFCIQFQQKWPCL